MKTSVFINELHYDNSGTDTGEGVEIAAPAGTDLSGWRIVLYNGANGQVYDTINLSGTIPDLDDGFGALFFARAGVQNGSPDGLALVDPSGAVVQFLSYEGSFVAIGGPANGMTSTDIGVFEGGSDPAGQSLRLTGQGTQYEDFTWSGSAPASFGAVNAGQDFVGAPPPQAGTLAIGDSAVREGNDGTQNLVFTVERADGSTGAITVDYAIDLVTADADDFAGTTPLTGTIAFADGQTTASLIVAVRGDTMVEPDETLTVTLSNPSGGATLGMGTATGTIVNDDTAAPPASAIAFINEIHYDNAGTDVGERVEIAGTAGLDLTGWTLVLYNGNGGAPYATIALSGVLPDQDDGYGTLFFATPGIQNGSPDGLALVDTDGSVVQFLSYEGTMMAVGGAADGMTSTDIGVAEDGGTQVGQSLQLVGSGSTYADFTWAAATPDSFGAVNGGQDFAATNPNGTLRIADASVAEGDDATTPLSFTVSRTGGTTGEVTVDYIVAFGSGSGFADLNDLSGPLMGRVTFADGQSTATVTVQVVGDRDGEPDETFTVRLSDATGGANIADTEATGTILNDDQATVTISAIQGASHRSAFEGQAVTTTGIVTAVDGAGFYLQDPTGDGDDATSDAIFVFTRSAPTVAIGDSIRVTGTVTEFVPSSSPDSLSVTELTSPEIVVLSRGNTLPDAVLIGPDGRTPPTANLEDDGFTSFDPKTDGLDFYESLEGMRVTVQSPIAVAPTNQFGEIWSVASRNGADAVATGLSELGPLVIDGTTGSVGTNNSIGGDFNPERIQIDADVELGSGIAPTVAAGTRLNDVTGVVNYSFGNYEVIATQPITVAFQMPLVTDTTALVGSANELSVATYNVLNLDPNDSDGDSDIADGRFTQIANDIGFALAAPGVIVLQEIQDNDGSVNSGTVSASVTLQTLTDEIFAQTGVRYSWLDNPFVTDGTNGGQPGGNIRVAFLWRPDVVTLNEGSIRTIGAPGEAGNPFTGARTPLVADFAFNGQIVTVVGNHFTSKGGSSPLEGAVQPSTNNGEARRAAQAAAVNDFVDTVLAADAGAHIVVTGDFNEFQFEEPLGVLTGVLNFNGSTATAGGTPVLENLTYRLPENERYSFIFEGNAQQIDHILVSNSLRDGAKVDAVHVNTPTGRAASDHDPVAALLKIGQAFATQTGTDAGETLLGTDGADRLDGRSGDDRLRGFDGNDELIGGNGNDVLEGGRGDDRMIGGAGNDSYFVDSTGDRVIEEANAGFDTVKTTLNEYTLDANVEVLQFIDADEATGFGNELNNTLFGNVGNDVLYGLSGDDRLVGGAGDDVLIGGTGRDSLEGGAGADRFVFNDGDFASLTKPDNIRDFDTTSGDVIDLSAIGGRFIGSASFGGNAGEVRFGAVGNNTFIYGDRDGDGRADFGIELVGRHVLSEDDFDFGGSAFDAGIARGQSYYSNVQYDYVQI